MRNDDNVIDFKSKTSDMLPDPQPLPCKRCNEKGIHVCLPVVVDMLRTDPYFRKLVEAIIKEIKEVLDEVKE